MSGGLLLLGMGHRQYVQRPATDVTARFAPGVINLRSHGGALSAFVFSSAEVDATTVEEPTVELTSVNGVAAGIAPERFEYADFDGDGLVDVMARFDRQALLPFLTEGTNTLRLEGRLAGGQDIVGTDEVRAIDP